MEEKKALIGCRVTQEKAQKFRIACAVLNKPGQAILEKAIDEAIAESERKAKK